MRKLSFIVPVAVVLIALFMSTVFIVDERNKALVLQFGRVVAVKEDPGLAFKIPFIQEVVFYDDRILSRDVDPLEVTPLDDRRLVVDAFTRYRITDVNQFREAVGTGGVQVAESRLDSILKSEMREVLGSVSSNDILSSDRAVLMSRIRNAAIEKALPLGIEVVDVRLKRTDLPRANLDATFPECAPSANVKPQMKSLAGTKRRSGYGPWRTERKLRSYLRRSANLKSSAVWRMQNETQSLPARSGQIRNSSNFTDLWRLIEPR